MPSNKPDFLPDNLESAEDISQHCLSELTDVAKDRLGKAQEEVGKQGLDYLLVTEADSLTALIMKPFKKLERPFIFVIPPSGQDPFFVIPKLEEKYAGEGHDAVIYAEFPAAPTKNESYISKLIEKLDGSQNIGLEKTTPSFIKEDLEQNGFNTKTTTIIDDLVTTDLQKSEIDMIRWACMYADMAVNKIIEGAYPGMSVIEAFAVGNKIKANMMKSGAWTTLLTDLLGPGFWKASAGSAHYVPAMSDTLEDGPNIAFAFPRVHGYWGECERTLLVNPSDELMEAYQSVAGVREAIFKALTPGVDGAYIDQMVKDLLADKGLADFIEHRTGHPIDIGLHGPNDGLAVGGNYKLTPGTVFSVEPGIVHPKLGVIRDSDTVVMNENGAEKLTHAPYGTIIIINRGMLDWAKKIRGMIIRAAVGIK